MAIFQWWIEMGMRRLRTRVWAVVASVMVVSTASVRSDDDHAAFAVMFGRTAALEGSAYGLGRDVLIRSGEASRTLLEVEAQHGDWRRRALAAVILAHLDDPEGAPLRRWVLASQTGYARFEDGETMTVVPPPDSAEMAERHGAVWDREPIHLGPDDVPLAVDVLLDPGYDVSMDTDPSNERAMGFLIRNLSAEWAEALLAISARRYQHHPDAEAALVGLGREALPALHKVVPLGGEREPRLVRQAELAASVLGTVGDASSAQMLVSMLDRLTSLPSVAIFASAIRQIGHDNPQEILFDLLLASVSGWPDRDWSPAAGIFLENGYENGYGALRRELVALGPPARTEAFRRIGSEHPVLARAIAAGVLYELEHPDEIPAFYETIGRYRMASQGQVLMTQVESAAYAAEIERIRKEHREEVQGAAAAVPTPVLMDSEEEIRSELIRQGSEAFWTSEGWTKDGEPGWTGSVEDVPAALRIEKATAWPRTAMLKAIAGLREDPMAFEVLRHWATHRDWWWSAVPALAEHGGPKIPDVYRQFLASHPGPDYDVLDTVHQALIVLDDPAGADVLDEFLHRAENDASLSVFHAGRPWGERTRLIAKRLREGNDGLAALLEDYKDPIRLAAARTLVARGDPRGVPALFDAAIAPSENASPFTTQSTVRHLSARDALVALGEGALPEIVAAAERSAVPYASLFAEALSLRIRHPAIVHATLEGGRGRMPNAPSTKLGPEMDGYRNAGRQLARAVGAEATALLEAAIVWPAERLSLPPQTAAFALSALGQERSIGIVVAHAHHLGWARGENVAAAVLVDFGEAGIAAARKIPPPDPQRQGMGVRGARHRSATRALVAVEDELGVEGVLAGLALAVDKKIEWGATCRYLETALRKPDPRMLPAMLDLLADDDHVRSLALAGILALKGAATPDCLLESLAASKGSMRRAGLVKALGRLPVATDRARIEAAIPAMRDAVLGTLAEDDEAVQSAAAEALAAFLRFLPGQDSPETVAALLAWLEDREAWPVPVIGALVDTGDPRVGPALHVRYREDPFGRYDLARCFATLGYEEACPDVARALDERLAREPGSDGIPELEVLAALGMPGQKAVLETTAAPERSEMRMQAMALLLSQGREEMFSPLLEQFETLCRMGPRDLRPVPGGYDPSTKHAHRVGELANLLLKHNAEAAYAVVAHASLADPNPELAGWLASSVARAAWDRPELRSIAVSLPKPLEN